MVDPVGTPGAVGVAVIILVLFYLATTLFAALLGVDIPFVYTP